MQQRGLVDASGFRLGNGVMLGSMVLALAVGAVAGLAMRRPLPARPDGRRPSAPDGALRAEVPDTAQVAWSGRLRTAKVGVAVLVGAIVLVMAGLAFWMWLDAQRHPVGHHNVNDEWDAEQPDADKVPVSGGVH